MFCKECGKEIDNDSKFCSYCGTKQSLKQVPDSQPDLRPKVESNTQNINVSLSFIKPNLKIENKNILKKDNEIVRNEKYDNTYKKEINATIVGIIVLIVLSILFLIGRELEDPFFISIYWVLFTIWWIIAIVWVVNIAKRQNRNAIGWGFFAFFLPNLAVIIIGILKKLKKDIISQSYNNSSVPNQNQIIVSQDFIPSTFIEKEFLKRTGFFDEGIQYEFKIEYSNGNSGSIYRLGKNVYLFYIEKKKIKVHYSDKESAIIGLDYYLQTHKIYKTNRLTGNILYYP